MKKILVPLAPGFEEIEAVTIIDILRRAGAQVVAAGLEKKNVTGAHGIHLVVDSVLADELDEDWDMIVLPGGVPGTPNLAADERLKNLLVTQAKRERHTAAVCAAPSVLEKAGVTIGKQITIHPTWADKLDLSNYTAKRVQVDGNIITGCSAGAAMEFAFELVKQLYGTAKVEEINAGVIAMLD